MSENGTPGIYAKLNKVMGQVGRIPKTGRNEFHGYDYATEADIVDEIRPIMAETGIAFIPSQQDTRQEVTVQTKSGETTVVKILHTFRFVDTEDGSEVEISVWGEGQDSMDKGSYKAFTGAEKYALLKTFMVATGDDPERDASRPRKSNGGRSRQASDRERSGDGAGHTCPDCGGPIWDNTDDEKAAANGGNRPNFKCKDTDGCDWASWDSEEEAFGGDDELPEAIEVALTELSGLDADRAATARDWAEKALRSGSDKSAVLGKVRQAIDDEQQAGQEPEDAEPEFPEARLDVEGLFHAEYGDEADTKLRLVISRHPLIQAGGNPGKLDPSQWEALKGQLTEHGIEAMVENPREALNG